MRRLKRRISHRQFLDWVQFHKVHPIDGDQRRDHLLAMAVLYSARAAGDEKLEYADLIVSPFDEQEVEGVPGLDPAILAAFSASD